MKNIKMNTYQILIDEKYSRLLCVGVSIHVFDLKTMRKITRIGGFSYLSYASIDYPGDKLYALNTVGDLKVFNLKDFALVASVKTGVKDGRIVINATKCQMLLGNFRNIKSKQRKQRVRKRTAENFSTVLLYLFCLVFLHKKVKSRLRRL